MYNLINVVKLLEVAMPFNIYRIDNTVNSKVYIGATTHEIEVRFEQHKSHVKSGKWPLYVAMREYGVDQFSVSLVEECPDYNTMRAREPELILFYNTALPNGYNKISRQLNDEQIALIKFRVFGSHIGKYAEIFGVSKWVVYSVTASLSQYNHITRKHIVNPNKYL